MEMIFQSIAEKKGDCLERVYVELILRNIL